MSDVLPEYWFDTTKASRKPERVLLKVNPAHLSQVANAIDVNEVLELSAEIYVRAWRSNGIALEGKIAALLVQSCAVTLDPVQTVQHHQARFRSALP